MKVRILTSNSSAFRVNEEVEYYKSLNGNNYLYSKCLLDYVNVDWAARLWNVNFEVIS